MLGRAPLSLLDFFHAAPIEAGLWIAKTREIFGGPVALAGFMHRDLVEQRQWVSEDEYRLALAQSPQNQVLKVALANLGMWVRDQYFPASYAPSRSQARQEQARRS